MTYKRQEVEKPTLQMIKEYCKSNHLEVPPGEIYKHYFDKRWLTKEVFFVEVVMKKFTGSQKVVKIKN